MTLQLRDLVLHKDHPWDLVCTTQEISFPQIDVLERQVLASCWKGYQLVFRIEQDHLELHQVRATAREPDRDTLFSRCAQSCEGGEERLFAHQFGPLGRAPRFTGHMVLGKRMLEHEILWHTEPWDYAQVLELRFEQDQLVEVIDQSFMTTRIRRALQHECAAIDREMWWFPIQQRLLHEQSQGTFFWKYFEPRWQRWQARCEAMGITRETG